MRASCKIIAVMMSMLGAGVASAADVPAPTYKVDPYWPKALPNNWVMGIVGGLAVDKSNNIWVLQRPKTVESYYLGAAQNPPVAECCVAAPPVLVFNQAGELIKSWGGPAAGYEWPSTEHGIAIDPKGNIWIGGSATRQGQDGSPADGQILKFSPDGKFLLQIGHAGPSRGSLDPGQLSGASDMAFDEKANEVFVADGYGNHRVIVFDMDTGKFKRMWGAYGKPPTDLPTAPPRADAPQFRLVHCIALSDDDLVYVCDRDNNRMQVFKKDGTFVAEHSYAMNTAAPGTVGDISLWPSKDQGLLAIADIGNFTVRIVRRADGRQVATVGRAGPYAGQLHRLHQGTLDHQGNLYTGEIERLQKFELVDGAK